MHLVSLGEHVERYLVGCQGVASLEDLVRRERRRATYKAAPRSGCRHTSFRSLADDSTLKFRHRCHDMERQTATRSGRIDSLVERPELDASLPKVVEFMRTPRIWLTCFDGGRQVMSIDTADDLDPWPSVADTHDVVADAKLVSQTGSFPELRTKLSASRVTHLMTISVDVTGRAEDVARSWMQGFPIKVKASPGGGLKDLDLVIFPEARSPAFRTEAAALVRGCEVLAGH